MQRKHVLNLVLSILVIFGLLASASPAYASPASGSSSSAELKGQISAVDAAAGSLTITPRTGSPVSITYNAATYIKRNGVRVTGDALQLGDQVEAKYNRISRLASKIEAKVQLSSARGVISAVDAAAGSLTILKADASSLTLSVNSATAIKRIGLRATLADLQVGDLIEVSYATVSLLAVKIEARLNIVTVKGSISAVDAAAGSLVVKNQVGGLDVSLVLDASTQVKRNGLVATTADLRVADLVEVKYNPVTLLAYRIEAKIELISLKGGLSAVDALAGTLTITDLAGVETTLDVDPTASIKRLGLPATLGDLQLGDLLEVKYNLASLVAYKIEAKLYRVSLNGSVSAVDSAAGTLSVLKTGTALTVDLSVDPAAVITRAGLPITLDDLQASDLLEVKYNPLTMVAYNIEVKLASFKGYVTAIDAAAGTLSVRNAYNGVTLALTVDPAAVITRYGQPYTLAQIVVGKLVELKYSAASLVVYRLQVK